MLTRGMAGVASHCAPVVRKRPIHKVDSASNQETMAGHDQEGPPPRPRLDVRH
jgi:hypothetical protein